VIYQRKTFRCGDDDFVTMWAPHDQTPLQTLQRLLEVYEIGASFAGKP